MPPIKDLTGRRYSKLTALKRVGWHYRPNGARISLWRCVCDCGQQRAVKMDDLGAGYVKSCGCTVRKQNGLSTDPVYNSWSSMMRRCYVKKDKDYKRYGAKGIFVQKSWHKFLVFRAWAKSHGHKPRLQIDRKNNDRGYNSRNSRWVTSEIQGRNRRAVSFHVFEGERRTIPQIAKRLGFSGEAIRYRIRNKIPKSQWHTRLRARKSVGG